MRPTALAGWALLLTLLPAPGIAAGDETPPAEGTRLEFRKTLYVHQGTQAKVFAETRRISGGEVLWRILKDEYGVSAKAIPTLIEAFREVNPQADPNRLKPGQVVRIPFKVESGMAATTPPKPDKATGGYTVRSGDSLAKILHNSYGVKRENMADAIRRVVRANPDIRNPNHLWVGQVIVIPLNPAEETPKPPASETTAAEEKPSVPSHFVSVLNLLESLGCQIDRQGQTYVPVERGRTLRLDGQEFPMVVGPSGRKVVLDPGSRLTPALQRAMESAWGYRTVQGVQQDAEAYLAELLPGLGFYELSEGARGISLGVGATLMTTPRWTVIATANDLWKGRIHLIFPQESKIDRRLAALARKQGYLLHRIATEAETPETPDAAAKPVRLRDSADVKGAAKFLELLGIPHELGPEVICRLGGNANYRICPLLTFEHGGLRYAVPPPTPERAEALLLKEGFFTFTWAKSSAPLGRIGDLVAFLGIEHKREEIEIPTNEALRLQVQGLTVGSPALLAALNAETGAAGRIAFVTEAQLEPDAVSVLREAGYSPLVLQ